MGTVSGYGTGRIGDIIYSIESRYEKRIAEVLDRDLLQELCTAMQFSPKSLDDLIANNSPVMRTVKGHVFETFFDEILREGGYSSEVVGGDTEIDRVVHGKKLQLKTPTESGTKGNLVQFKTHKTHGAKSEMESMDYYSTVDHFADYLVGLISYEPLNILIMSPDELPRHKLSERHIQSPFTLDWSKAKGLNAFDRIGVDFSKIKRFGQDTDNELLPRTASKIGVDSGVILRTILSQPNFRIWDMSIRGFIREQVFKESLNSSGVATMNPMESGRPRADKADLAIKVRDGLIMMQMKGVSTNNCNFDIEDPEIATETQLTRGRVNDHPTQSRLYLKSDFDTLIIGLDPPIVEICREKISGKKELKWEFYAIPVEKLLVHPSMPHRLKSLQKFKYSELQQYLVDDWKNFVRNSKGA